MVNSGQNKNKINSYDMQDKSKRRYNQTKKRMEQEKENKDRNKYYTSKTTQKKTKYRLLQKQRHKAQQ